MPPVSGAADGRQHRDRRGARCDERHRDEPVGDCDDTRRDEERGGGDAEHLIGAELRDEPERRHECPDDAPHRRDREEAACRAPEMRELARPQAHRDRRHRREDDARSAEQQYGCEERVGARTGIPAHHGFEDGLVEKRNRKHAQRAERDRPHEQLGPREPVGEHTAGPVADREAAEYDPDQRAPDEERVAEERREDTARGDLDAEKHGSGQEDGDGDRDGRCPHRRHRRP